MKKENTQQEPPQEGDLEDWIADSLVYIQNMTTSLSRDLSNFQGRVEVALDDIKNHGDAEQFDTALGYLRTATRDFTKAGFEVDMKRRTLGTWPIMILGFVLITVLAAQTAFLSGGLDGFAYLGLTEQNRTALKTCFQAVRDNNQAYQCTLIIRPKDL